MEKRVTQIGDVVLTSPMHVEEFYSPEAIIASTERAIDGNFLFWEQLNPFETRTLVSMESGWQLFDVKELIIAQYKQLATLFTLHYSDGTTETVRYNHSEGISFTPLWEGSEYYTAKINLVLAN